MKKLLLCVALFLFHFHSSAQCITTVSVNSFVCDTICSGDIIVDVTGGVMPFNISFSDGPNQWGPFTGPGTYSHYGLCQGYYSLQVTDANGDTCSGSTSFVIPYGAPPLQGQVNVVNASCSGCMDGSATVVINGGIPPYSYQWSNGTNTQSINNLSPGTYTVIVVDVNGCATQFSFVVGIGFNGNVALIGDVYFDLNSNGIKEAGENGIGNQLITITPGNVNAISNNTGEYGIVVTPGTYDVTWQTAAGWNLTSTPASYNVTVSNATVDTLDFGIFPDSTAGIAVVTLCSGFPRCFWDVPYYPTIINTGFTILDGSMVFTYDPLMTFVSSSIVPFSHVGNVMTYAFSNLFPGQTFSPVVTLTEPAGGTPINHTLTANASDLFGNQLSLNTTLSQTVNCSYDPNDKQVNPIGQGPGNYVAMDTWLDYQVRFQNTGTDTAFTVVILDTLSSGLDISTFTLLGSSHPVNVSMRPGREVAFIFNNILLPDSNVNEPGSNGYVLFRIKGMTNNPDPTVVNNTAYIYFDLNSPVQTNVTLTTFSDNWLYVKDQTDENIFEIYPNPMNDKAILKLITPSQVNYQICIKDLSGRIIQSTTSLINGSMNINVSGFSSGNYIIEAIPENSNKPIYIRMVKN